MSLLTAAMFHDTRWRFVFTEIKLLSKLLLTGLLIKAAFWNSGLCDVLIHICHKWILVIRGHSAEAFLFGNCSLIIITSLWKCVCLHVWGLLHFNQPCYNNCFTMHTPEQNLKTGGGYYNNLHFAPLDCQQVVSWASEWKKKKQEYRIKKVQRRYFTENCI